LGRAIASGWHGPPEILRESGGPPQKEPAKGWAEAGYRTVE